MIIVFLIISFLDYCFLLLPTLIVQALLILTGILSSEYTGIMIEAMSFGVLSIIVSVYFQAINDKKLNNIDPILLGLQKNLSTLIKKYINSCTIKRQFEILQKMPSFIQYINKPSKQLIKLALDADSMLVRYVSSPSDKNVDRAYYKNSRIINYLPENQIERLISTDPSAIEDLTDFNLTDDKLIKYIQINPEVVNYIEFFSTELEAFCKLSNIQLPYE